MFKKLFAGTVSAAMLAASLNVLPVSAAASDYNYAEALQKSLYFYECQQAGPLPEWNRVEWRSDSTVTDEVTGGWYDAGDHVKFNLPMAYSASMLAWGLYQYPEGIEKCGEMTNYVNNLEFVMDYLAECDRGDEVVYQVGNGTIDHTWWGPVELLEYGMADSGTSYDKAREILVGSEGISNVVGDMAAALAAGSVALKGRVDDTKLKSYLSHAENLFKIASTDPGMDVYNNSDAAGFYRSSHFYDELFYAANWLYIATKDSKYLDAAKSYIPHLDTELGSDELKYTWEQCWDDVMQGGMLLYAINTQDPTYIARVKKHVDYVVNDAKKVDGKLLFIHSWGCARYAETSAFITSVACDTVLKGESNIAAYEAFAKQQVDYVLGDNPLNQSYVVGYGENSAHNAHHRTAHGSWKNDVYEPVDNRHTLYGALVGGPTEAGDYEDDRNNYINNEVATDYNAGFTAALCKMIEKYGGETDPSFPPVEQHDGPEFYVETLVKGEGSGSITLSFKVTNHSAWPARVQDNISFRYYMDLSELKAAGYDPMNAEIRCDRNQSEMYASKGIAPGTVSKIQHYSGDIYYIEVTLPDGRAVLPVSEGMQQCEFLIAMVCPGYGSVWDASNDFSNKEILGAEGETDKDGNIHGIKSKYIPVYIDGQLYYGEEPDGTSADGGSAPVVTTTKATTTATTSKVTTTTTTSVSTSDEQSTDHCTELFGDLDDNGSVSVADIVLALQFAANSSKYPLDSDSVTRGDVNLDGVLDAKDAFIIQQLDAGIYTQSDMPLTK
ncbi:MAG: glycoside hydrolase family 9 protein [Ruminococcus sp.]|nr:glycoside hydrolase family 9 protein [Ruminococcus sp.]